MVVAWFFDVTTGGMQRTLPASEGELKSIVDQPLLKRWPIGLAAVVGTFLLMGAVGWELKSWDATRNSGSANGAPLIGSVGVLPFLNLMGEDEDLRLSEGVSKELMEALRRIPGLRVTGRTSALSDGNGETGAGGVVEEVGVASHLEGSVGDSVDHVELAVRLVSANDMDSVWTKSYRLPKAGFLTVLDSVAWEIAGQLGAEVPKGERWPLVRPTTVEFVAYRDYLSGRYLSDQGTREALESAITSFNRALLLDPEFGPAWAALAKAYVLLPEYGGPPMQEILPYVQAALDQAMKPGREMAEGFAVSGFLKWVYHWDRPGAEEDFLRSIDLDPENHVARYWFARYLATERRWEEGLDQVNRALEMEPMSAAAHMSKGMLLFCAGLEGAEASFRRALELAPDMHSAAYILAGYLAMEGDLKGSAEEFDRFSQLTGTDPAFFRTYLAALRDPSKSGETVAALQGAGFYGSVQGAQLLAHLGEVDAALTLLERAVGARSPYLPWVNALPQFEGFRSNPRFHGILVWVGF
jgi:TolB-like protein/tetratricopeptide (TPR) repeat protein